MLQVLLLSMAIEETAFLAVIARCRVRTDRAATTLTAVHKGSPDRYGVESTRSHSDNVLKLETLHCWVAELDATLQACALQVCAKQSRKADGNADAQEDT
jgi:hypothetical protein